MNSSGGLSNNPNRFGVDVVPGTIQATISDLLRFGLLGPALREPQKSQHFDKVCLEHYLCKVNEWFEMDRQGRVNRLGGGGEELSVLSSTTPVTLSESIRPMKKRSRSSPLAKGLRDLATPSTYAYPNTAPNTPTSVPAPANDWMIVEGKEMEIPSAEKEDGITTSLENTLSILPNIIPAFVQGVQGVVGEVPAFVQGVGESLEVALDEALDTITAIPEAIIRLYTGPERWRLVTYSPVIFALLRKKLQTASTTIQREARGATWSTAGSPGKSPSIFFFFGSFVWKSVTKEEWTYFQSTFFTSYVSYVSAGPDGGTLLPHLYLMVRIKNMSTNTRYRFVLMNNVFRTTHVVPLIYDLKGSCVGRDGIGAAGSAPPKRTANGVILRKDNDVGPEKLIKLRHTKRAVFLSTLRADCAFLKLVNVIDYSLVVGVRTRLGTRASEFELPTEPVDVRSLWSADGGMTSYPLEENGTPQDTSHCYAEEIYYMGLVDIMQPYNTRKMLETLTKGMMFDKTTISVIPSADYAARMCAMAERLT